MRNPQLLFFSPVLGDGKRSACSLALVSPSKPFTPMSMNHPYYTTSAPLGNGGIASVILYGEMHYSLVGVALAFAAGTVFGSFLPPDLAPGALWGVAAGIALASILLARFRRGFLAGLLVTVALLGALRYQTAQPPLGLLYRRASRLHEVTGTVVSYPDLGEGYTAFTLAPDNLPAKIRVTRFWGNEDQGRIRYGDRLHLVGSTKVPHRFSDFDYRVYLARQEVFATMAVDDEDQTEWLGTGGSRLLRLGDTLRQKLLDRLDRVLPPREAALAHGLLFAERAALSKEVEEAFRRTGLMHLLAVSGLHLGIFLAGLWFALRVAGLRPAFTYPVVGVAVLLVLVIVGPRVSLVRAALLFAFLGLGSVLADLGILLRRWVHPSQGLAAAALVILAIRPTVLFDVGFQLSFGATAAIITAFHPVFGVQKRIDALAKRASLPSWCVRYPLGLLLVSAAAQAGTAPFIAYHFGAIYPFVLIANLLVIPLATCALWSGLLTLLLSWSPLVLPARILCSWVLKALIWIVERLGGLPFVVLSVPSWMGIWIGGLVLYLIGLALYLREPSLWT